GGQHNVGSLGDESRVAAKMIDPLVARGLRGLAMKRHISVLPPMAGPYDARVGKMSHQYDPFQIACCIHRAKKFTEGENEFPVLMFFAGGERHRDHRCAIPLGCHIACPALEVRGQVSCSLEWLEESLFDEQEHLLALFAG